jgi:NAD(P)-dependent dehydrogenase (short-subunit alcohol dehydrogenase family)
MVGIDLHGRQIVITGGLGAIAGHVVARLREAGATMIVTDIVPADRVSIDQVPIEDARRPHYFTMDVTDPAEVCRVVTAIFDAYPELDIALGNAGGTPIAPFLETPLTEFERLVRFNFLGQVYFAHAVAAQWVKRGIRGHLIFTSSYVSRIPMVGISAYTAAKAALEMFVKNLALEVAPHGIRVNAVSPGNVAAGSSLKVYESDAVYRAWVDHVSPLGKRNSPGAIADAFLFLCSPLANEIDGQVLQVDMGVGLPKLG